MAYSYSADPRYPAGKGPLRPLLEVDLQNGKRIADYVSSLVDSGSQDTLFDPIIAEQLGINFETLPAENILIGGSKRKGYLARVALRPSGHGVFVPIEIRFVPGLPFSGILGNSFFEHYNVHLKMARREFEISPAHLGM